MIYFLVVFMIGCGYYSLTYGISLWKEDGNRLGGAAAAAIAVIGTIVPGVVLFMQS